MDRPQGSTSNPPSQVRQIMDSFADDLLYGLDIEGGDVRDFLKSLIASGRVPKDELRQLCRASLMQGVDEWYMLLHCARSIRNQAHARAGPCEEPGVVPYVAYVLSGRAAADQASLSTGLGLEQGKPKGSKRRRLPRAVSRLRDDAGKRDCPAEEEQVDARPQPPAAKLREGGDYLNPAATGKKRRRSGRNQDTGNTCRCGSLASDERPSLNSEGGRDGNLNCSLTKSPYFGAAPTYKKPRPPRGTISSLPFPPLSAPRFGLIQEELADNPFLLLVAVTLLIRTNGRAAIPAFRQLAARFPTPGAMAAADPADIVALTRHLGLSEVRCAAMQLRARLWLRQPPAAGVRFRVRGYPLRGAGARGGVAAAYEPEGDGGAWEIGHLTQGPYAIDSWRIFCRDALLGRARDWNGGGARPTFQPEWMRVLPADKELRACLRWMWMREGWEWDPRTGEREVLREPMRRAVDEGRVGYDASGELAILKEVIDGG